MYGMYGMYDMLPLCVCFCFVKKEGMPLLDVVQLQGNMCERTRLPWRPVTPMRNCVNIISAQGTVSDIKLIRTDNSRKHLCFLVFKGCFSRHPGLTPSVLLYPPLTPSVSPPPAGSDQKPVFFRGCRSFAQPKKLFLWKDRTLFGGCIGSAKR